MWRSHARGEVTSTSTSIARSNGVAAYQHTNVFDELGRMIRSIGAGSQTTSLAYDRASNLVSETDPRAGVFSHGFDPLNRLIKETDQTGAIVNLTRNGKDEVTAYQDPRNVVTTYVRNGFGEAIQETSPDKGTTVFVRDARGLVKQRTDSRGVVTNYSYDIANRPTGKTYAGQTQYWQNFNWDPPLPNARGRLVGVYSEAGVDWRLFDAKGRITSDYRTNNPAPARLTTYTYDDAGNIRIISYPSGRLVTYVRDAAGRVSQILTRQVAASPTQTLASAIGWNPYGPLSTLTFGNGLVATNTVDADYRVTRVQVGSVSAPGATLDHGAEHGLGVGRDLFAVRGDELSVEQSGDAGHAVSGAVVPAGERAGV